MGNHAVSDLDSVAIGNHAGSDVNAVAMGNHAVSNLDSVAIGNHAVSDVNAVAIGVSSKANSGSIAIGSAARADYQNSTAIGADSATTRSNQIAIGSKTSELTISNLEGTDTGVTYVEDDGTLRRSSVTTNMLEGFDERINKLGDGVQGQIDDNRTAINSNRNNIKSLGEGVAASTALSSAMTALPTVSADSQLTCGVGTGTYSGATAVALGCASKVNDRLSFNIGGSKVLQGSSNYEYGSGSLDSFAARAGLVMRLGKLHKPNATVEELQARLQHVEAENKEINEKYESVEHQNKLIQQDNELIQQQNKQLMARLERLEAIALSIQQSTGQVAVVSAAVAQ